MCKNCSSFNNHFNFFTFTNKYCSFCQACSIIIQLIHWLLNLPANTTSIFSNFKHHAIFMSFYLTNSIANVYICHTIIYFPLCQILICTCQYDFGICFNFLAFRVDVDGSIIVEVECFVGFDQIRESAKGTSKFFIIKCYEISIVEIGHCQTIN